jgi:hypothetical protein
MVFLRVLLPEDFSAVTCEEGETVGLVGREAHDPRE